MDTESTTPGSPPPSTPPVAPPVITPPAYAPPRPRQGRGWKIFALVLLVLLLLGAVGVLSFGWAMSDIFRLGVTPTRTAGPKFEEVMVEDNDAAAKIAVVELEGIISSDFIDAGGGYSLVELVKAQLARAREDSRVKAIVLKVNSPGGEVLASDQIYRAIAEFQKKSGKPAVASMGSLAASGGYYVAAPCQWIVANELTITGSIGVILQAWNYRGLMDKVGLRPFIYKSGKYKDMLSGAREPADIPPEEREMIQSLIDETFRKFKSVVAEGRDWARQQNKADGQSLSQDWEEYADGRVLLGTEAYRLGFVDELGDFDAAVKRAKRLARVSEANVVKYQQRLDLTDIFRLFGETDAKVVKVDMGMDLPKLQAGKLYFLSFTVLH